MNVVLAWALAVLLTLLVLWIALIVILFVKRPAGLGAAEIASLFPDIVRLSSRLARDRQIPRWVRWRVWFLLAWLASPIDLIPDFIPVIGLADDAVLVYLVLRSVARAAGPEVVAEHWPGSPEGLDAVRHLLRL